MSAWAAWGVRLALLCLAISLGTTVRLGMAGLPESAGGSPLTLRSLKIVGAKIVPAKKVKEELTLPLPSPWPWKKPPGFRQEELEHDVDRLKLFYRRQGFYHSQISSTVKRRDGKAEVIIKIVEGPWIKVTRVDLKAPPDTPQPTPKELQKQDALKPGDRFSEESYEALKRHYLNHLLDRGHPKAKVEGRVLLDDQADTAEIELTLKPGPFCFFGEVRIKGDIKVPEYLVQRKLTFKPGAPFSFKELYDSQRQLYAMDLFQSVLLTPEEVPENERRIPVTVQLQEKKKRSLKVGLGYGDEDEFRARLGLRFRNVLGGGRMLDVDGKISRLEYRVEGAFLNPQIWATRNDLVARTGFIRRDLPGFDDKAYFSQVRLERDLPWKVRGYLGYGLEFSRPFNVPLETLLLLKETQTGKIYTASMVQTGLRLDTTDNFADPTRGGFYTLSGELAPDFLGSTLQFARTVVDVRRYQGLGDTGVVLAGRLKLGIIEPIQGTADIPIFRRFFCGGANSVRGYRLDYLGPRTLAGSPLGGEALLEGSVEARIPIYKKLKAVTFLDFGNVFLKIRDLDVGQLKYSCGFGLRYHTPVGPLGVDLGIPLNPIDPKRDTYRFHFTIGQAF